MEEKRIRVANRKEELNAIRQVLESIRDEWMVDEKIIFNLDLSIDEIFSNIVNYGYTDEKKHFIDFIFTKKAADLFLIIMDDGLAFDPLAHNSGANNCMFAEDAQIGGLGIHFVKNLMKEIKYERKNNYNILILKP